MTARALIVAGSLTAEDRYGVESAGRVEVALGSRGWDVESIHASESRTLLRRLIEAPPSVVVPVGFGAPCEDGHVCALSRIAGIPCAGPTPAAGSIMQDKSVLTHLVESLFPAGFGVRAPHGASITVGLGDDAIRARIDAIEPPLVIKPSWAGSSEGLVTAQSTEEAIRHVKPILKQEGKVLVQHLETPVAEVSCTVLDTADGPLFLPIVELRRDDVAVLGADEKFGSQALDRHIIPARVTEALADKIRQSVLLLHDEVGAIGLTRTDILVLASDELVMLELNGIPGLLQSSIACDAALAAGISFPELCELYLKSAFLRRPEPDIWRARQ
jgi:D-alanine--D-alanine ligase